MTSRMSHKSPFGVAGNPYNMFFASLILHLLILAAVMMSIPGSSRPLTFGAAYSVALVGPEVIPAPQNASIVKEMMRPSTPDQPVILKRDVLKAATSIIKKDDAPKQQIEKAINALRKKNLSKSDTDPVAKARTGTMGAGSTTASAEAPSRANDYIRFIWPGIKKNWVLPASLMPKDNVTAIIEVRIGQSGTLEYIGFEKRSGNTYFDESALRAVKKSAPFPPLTGWTTGRSIEIGIRFHSAELR